MPHRAASSPSGTPSTRVSPTSPASTTVSTCGCQIFGHLTRPAHTHGAAHQADPAAPPSQPARTPLVRPIPAAAPARSEEHTSELQSQSNLVCRLLLEKKKKKK